MRLRSVAGYLVAAWISHSLLSAHYVQTCRGTFLAALTGADAGAYCTLLNRGLRALEASPLLLAAAARNLLPNGAPVIHG